jgi:hypothetical protein
LNGFSIISKLLTFQRLTHLLLININIPANNLVFVTIFLLKVLFLNSSSRFLVHGTIENIEQFYSVISHKAFDDVIHELVIFNLEFYGVKGSILNWLKSYLHNIPTRVVLQFVSSPNLLLDWEIDMGFLRDLFWPHYCSMCILMIFHAPQTKLLIPFFLQLTLIFLVLPVILMNYILN